MNKEQLRLWQEKFQNDREAEIAALKEKVQVSLNEFIAMFRSHELVGRTWRQIRYWNPRGHRSWVEFQLSKAAMQKLLEL